GGKAFYFCTSLESLKFPSTLNEVGEGAFDGCEQLREVLLNEGLQKIGGGAFYFCTLLESLKFPSTLTEVGDRAFEGCRNLREVLLNEGLKNIGNYAFGGCSSLETITFPCISRRVRTLSQDSQTAIENKINEIPGGEWSGEIMLFSPESMANDENWETTRNSLDMILGLIAYHELKEATTIFELALWKARINEETASSTDERNACRIDAPGAVKYAVMQFLSYNRDW
ncbi:hypothetical protein ACHAXR_008785, partial [Thalassiosira sp. AJA248-18]